MQIIIICIIIPIIRVSPKNSIIKHLQKDFFFKLKSNVLV